MQILARIFMRDLTRYFLLTIGSFCATLTFVGKCIFYIKRGMADMYKKVSYDDAVNNRIFSNGCKTI